MRQLRALRTGCASLLVIWTVTAAGIWFLRALTPKAEHVLSHLQGQPLGGRSDEQRREFLDGVATALNQLDPAQRRRVQLSDEIHTLYSQMTSGERLRFLENTRRPGNERMAKAFLRMSPDRRSRHLNEALSDLHALQPGNRLGTNGSSTRQRLEHLFQNDGTQGSADTSAADALELQPLIEQTQRVLQRTN